jgi:spermidine synthase
MSDEALGFKGMQPDRQVAGNSRPIFNTVVAGSATICGFLAVSAQLILLREFVSVFGGNEMLLGVFLSVWMLLTGAGALLGTRIRRVNFRLLIMIFFMVMSLLPSLSLCFLDETRDFWLGSGVLLPLHIALGVALITLAPFCLLSGMVFPMLTRMNEADERFPIRFVYLFEALGSVLGGLFVLLFLLYVGDSYAAALFLTILGIVVVAWNTISDWNSRRAYVLLGFIIITFYVYYRIDGNKHREALYGGEEIVEVKDAATGNYAMMNWGDGKSYYCDGNLLFTSGRNQEDEEPLYFARLQRKHMYEMLVIGGKKMGMPEMMNDIPFVQIVALQEEKAFVELQDYFLQDWRGNSRFSLRIQDAREYMRNTKLRFDAIVINAPEPSNLGSNRYYTSEFFSLARTCLTDSGVILLSLPSAGNYVGGAKKELHSITYNTLKKEFPFVGMIPSERDYFVASDHPTYDNMAARSVQLHLKGVYVNPDYIDDVSVDFKRQERMSKIDTTAGINTDYKPVALSRALEIYSEKSGSASMIIMAGLGLLLLIPLFLGRSNGAGIWMTGFTGTAAEVILMYYYQSMFGSLYMISTLIFSFFMLGLALGAFFMRGEALERLTHAGKGQAILAVCCSAIPLLLLITQSNALAPGPARVFTILLVMLIAFVSGQQFVRCASLDNAGRGNRSGLVYAIDLSGSALGGLIMGVLLIPAFGLMEMSVALMLMNFLVAALMYLLRK